ncbi:MAG TPA: hypothetical protein VMT95_02915 [Candidatus Binatia bacterium]|nr:hypothetical protein [Candidatus Binatia bacterium]
MEAMDATIRPDTGNRIELLLRAPKTEKSYTLSSLDTRDIFP